MPAAAGAWWWVSAHTAASNAMALVLTTAVRSLVHRFRDAERDGCGAGRVTDDQACHVACAQYYHILQLPERQQHSLDVPDPPSAWKLAGCDKEDTLTQVGEKLQAVISLQGHGKDAVAFVLKHYNSTLTGKWRASVGSYGMPKTARGTDVAVHKTSRYPRMNVISGMAGTPGCGAWVCKCVGGLIEETEIRKHFDSAAKMKLHDGRLEAKMNSERRAAAVVRAAGIQVPPGLQKRIDRCEVLSVTETMASSASSSGSSSVSSSASSSSSGTRKRHIDSLVEANKRAYVNSLPRVRRAMHAGRYHVFTEAMQNAQVRNAGVDVRRVRVVLPTD